MEQCLSMITLGVADLKRAVVLYENLIDWEAHPGPSEITFVDLGGLVFSLYPHQDMSNDINKPPGEDGEVTSQGFALVHNAHSKNEVHTIFARLKANGVIIVKEPEKVFRGGYSGNFTEPDGYPWEVAYNSHWNIQADVRVSMNSDWSANPTLVAQATPPMMAGLSSGR